MTYFASFCDENADDSKRILRPYDENADDNIAQILDDIMQVIPDAGTDLIFGRMSQTLQKLQKSAGRVNSSDNII